MPSPTEPDRTRPTPASRRNWIWLIGLVVTGVLLWWSLHDVSLRDVWSHVRAANPILLAVAVALATLTFPLRAIRWRTLLETDEGRPSLTSLWHAVAIGFMANNILPARAGEVARAYVGSRLATIRFTTAIGSLALERALDGLVIVALTAIPLLGPGLADATVADRPLGPVLRSFGLLFAAVTLVAAAIAARPALARQVVHRVSSIVLSHRWTERVTDIADGIVSGLAALRHARRAAVVVTWSVVLWLVNAASFWVALEAFGIDAPIGSALLVQGFIAFGVAIPSSPGYFGVFEFAARAALTVYAVDATLAVSYAVGYHITTFIPITVLGLWSLKHLHLRVADITRPAPEAVS